MCSVLLYELHIYYVLMINVFYKNCINNFYWFTVKKLYYLIFPTFFYCIKFAKNVVYSIYFYININIKKIIFDFLRSTLFQSSVTILNVFSFFFFFFVPCIKYCTVYHKSWSLYYTCRISVLIFKKIIIVGNLRLTYLMCPNISSRYL